MSLEVVNEIKGLVEKFAYQKDRRWNGDEEYHL